MDEDACPYDASCNILLVFTQQSEMCEASIFIAKTEFFKVIVKIDNKIGMS